MVSTEARLGLLFIPATVTLGWLYPDFASHNPMNLAPQSAAPDRIKSQDEELTSLLAATGLHDRKAFKQLYELTSAQMYGIALRILDRQAWAQDVLQEAYIKIWKNASSYQAHRAAPRTWMVSIVRNQALDFLRKHNHEASPMLDIESIDESLSEEALPGEALALNQEGQRLSDCLKRLQGEQRQVIALAYFRGLSHEQLSQHSGHPLGTIKTWIRRGLDQLRGCLES